MYTLNKLFNFRLQLLRFLFAIASFVVLASILVEIRERLGSSNFDSIVGYLFLLWAIYRVICYGRECDDALKMIAEEKLQASLEKQEGGQEEIDNPVKCNINCPFCLACQCRPDSLSDCMLCCRHGLHCCTVCGL